MSALAALLAESGYRVSGSDTAFDPPVGPYLDALGIECMPGWNDSNLDPHPDLVVVGNVCRKDNPEAQGAFDRGIPTLSMPGRERRQRPHLPLESRDVPGDGL